MAARFAGLLEFPEPVMAESIRQTTFWVPAPGENRRRVREYHEQVRDLLTGSGAPLGDDFFCPE